MRQSILLPYSDSNPIQVFLDTIAAIHYDGANAVELTIVGNPTPLAIPVTDADDASAMLLQMNLAFGSQTTTAITIPGNPAAGAAPTGLATVNEFGEVNLTWTPVSSNYTYNVYRSDVSGSGYVLIGSTASASFVDPNQISGATYYYVVTTVSTRGESAFSSEVNGTTLIPDVPTSLSVTPTYYKNSLTWDAVSGDAAFPDVSYNIYQDGVFNTNFTSPSADIFPLNSGQLYSYTVSAVINGIEGAQCGAATGTPTAILAPTGVSCTPGSYSNYIAWSAVTGAETYLVYGGTTPGGETLISLDSANLFYTDANLPDGTTFYYKVAGGVNSGVGPQSSEVSGTPINATFVSYSPDPMSVIGGTLEFTGTGFDPSQAGIMRSTETGDLACSYIDSTHLTVNVPGGVPAGNVQFYYVAGGSDHMLPFLVAFS